MKREMEVIFLISTIQDGIQANPGSQGYFIRANFTKQLWWEKGGGAQNKVHA